MISWTLLTREILQILWSLRRIGRPIYGFDPETYSEPNRSRHQHQPEQRGA